MDDFVNKVAFGLNLSFSHGIGIPKTRWLLWGGARNEGDWKAFLRHHEMPTPVWYKAYPGPDLPGSRPQRAHPQGARERPRRRPLHPPLAGRDLREATMPTAILERDDIQALVRSGFGKLEGSRLLLVRVRPGREAQAREWLRRGRGAERRRIRRRAPRQAADQPDPPGRDHRARPRRARRSGRGDGAFPPISSPGSPATSGRSLRLGDVGENSPSRWKWGRKGERAASAADALRRLRRHRGVRRRHGGRARPELRGAAAPARLLRAGDRAVRLQGRRIAAPDRLGRGAHARRHGRPDLHQLRQRRRGAARLSGRI